MEDVKRKKSKAAEDCVIDWTWWQKYEESRWRDLDLWEGKRLRETTKVFVFVSECSRDWKRRRQRRNQSCEQRRGMLSDWQLDFCSIADYDVTDKPPCCSNTWHGSILLKTRGTHAHTWPKNTCVHKPIPDVIPLISSRSILKIPSSMNKYEERLI